MSAGPSYGDVIDPRRKVQKVYLPDILAMRRELGDGPKRLYERGVRWADETGTFWYGFSEMAGYLGKCERQIRDDMAVLERAALIRHKRRGGRQSNVYEFLWHPWLERQDSANQKRSSNGKIPPIKKPDERQDSAIGTAGSLNMNGRIGSNSGSASLYEFRQELRTVISSDRAAVISTPLDSDENFRRTIGVFLAFGVAMNDQDRMKCAHLWVDLTDEEKTAAVTYAESQATGEWRTRDTRYIPKPWNYLREKHWSRVQPPRMVRKATEKDLAHERAAAAFMAGRNSQ